MTSEEIDRAVWLLSVGGIIRIKSGFYRRLQYMPLPYLVLLCRLFGCNCEEIFEKAWPVVTGLRRNRKHYIENWRKRFLSE